METSPAEASSSLFVREGGFPLHSKNPQAACAVFQSKQQIMEDRTTRLVVIVIPFRSRSRGDPLLFVVWV